MLKIVASLSDDSGGFIYAPRVFNRTFVVRASLMLIVNYDCHIFIVQAIGVLFFFNFKLT
jgi:hypothetical protein